MYTVTLIKDHLVGMGHGGTLNKVRNLEAMMQRSAARMLLKVKILEGMRKAALESPVYDDVYDGNALPDDFGSIIDLMPQDDRQSWDMAFRKPSGEFDLQKAIKSKTISIEGREGEKVIRINWRSRQGKVLNSLNSVTGNGTWSAVGSAAGVATDTIFKIGGGGSVKFRLVASGDGIQNTSMSQVDMTNESQVADVFVWVYLPATTGVTGMTAVWGNDLTTKFWTAVAQTTQADGTAFKIGWNLIKFPWSTATQTGTVTATQIDSFKITIASSVALTSVRVDKIVFAIGRNFDIVYYSKFLFKDKTSGVWKSRPEDDGDLVMVDEDSLALYLMEMLKDMAHQMEGTDGAFDITYAEKQLADLFPAYKGSYPSFVKKQAGSYGGLPFRNRRGFRRW